MATNNTNTNGANKGNAGKGKGKAGDAPVIKLDTAAALALGKTVGTEATKANVTAGGIWATARTHYVVAQTIGKADEWVSAFGKGIKSIKGKKAPWARTYLSILTRAAKLGVKIEDAMGANDAQKAVKTAQDEKADPAQKAKEAWSMAERFIRSAFENGADTSEALASFKAIVAEYE
jgi:hypothetical protein